MLRELSAQIPRRKIGQLTGAKVLVGGRVLKDKNNYVTILASIIGTENGRMFSETEEWPRTNLEAMTFDLAKKITQTIADQSTNFIVTAPVSREERISQIIKNINGKQRPTVSVKINEQMPGDATAHQTAETELGLLLQKAGFSVVDEKSDQKADLIITGDAILVDNQKTGKLFSGHAILEIKAQQRTTGKILSLDRQDGVAIDISEAIAAKKHWKTPRTIWPQDCCRCSRNDFNSNIKIQNYENKNSIYSSITAPRGRGCRAPQPGMFSTNNNPPQVLTVAVFDFESPGESVRDLGKQISALVSANLSAEPNLNIVERAELEKVLGEQEMSLSGTIAPDSAAKIGQLTGAKVLITGRVFDVNNQRIVVAKVIGTETSRVYGEIASGNSETSITDLSAQLAKKIAADVTAKGDTLIAKADTRDDRIAKIKKELGDKKLPAVSVKISEQHFGQFVIDPAAQTEMSLILQQCGFTVVDEVSTNKPDVEITGEAFSEFGMSKGNLKSCRARIEIKARDVASGNIISVDRQTSVAVDLAEHIAAKTALENSADELAERVIPQLVK